MSHERLPVKDGTAPGRAERPRADPISQSPAHSIGPFPRTAVSTRTSLTTQSLPSPKSRADPGNFNGPAALARDYGSDEIASGGASGSRMDREAQEHRLPVLAGVGFILSPSARTGLADLAPWAKVVQTMGCSTFTHGAKPATRRVADDERMNLQGNGGAFAPIPTRRRAPGRRAPGTVWRTRGRRLGPRGVWAVAPAVPAPHCLRGTRQDLPCTSAAEPAPCHRRAISVQLAPATSGLSRSLADTPTRRSGHVKRRSRTDSQADSAGSIPVICSVICSNQEGPMSKSALWSSSATTRRERSSVSTPQCLDDVAEQIFLFFVSRRNGVGNLPTVNHVEG